MRIYHNIPALTAYNALNATNKALSKSIEKLSTGLRINSAADDAAGLAISEKMRAQISGMEVATRNAEDGISMLQTAEGALSESHSILQRMRELAVQASNDTLTSEDRSYLQLEVDQLKDQIDRIAKTTQFNKKRLLDGSSSGIWSSTNLTTKAYFRGSLREIDQFGQKSAFEGNFKITIQADPGKAETKKTDIFKIKHPNVVVNVSLNESAGAQSVRVDNVPAASYTMEAKDVTAATTLTGAYGFLDPATGNPLDASDVETLVAASGTPKKNASILFEITAVNETAKTVTVKASSSILNLDGTVESRVLDNIVLSSTDAEIGALLGEGAANDEFKLKIDESDMTKFSVGAKFVYNAVAAGTGVEIDGRQTDDWPYKWSNPDGGTPPKDKVVENPLQFGLTPADVKNKEIHFRNFFLNRENGTVYEGDIVLTTNEEVENLKDGDSLGSFDAAFIGKIATADTKLRDLDKFWNSSGVFMLNEPKTITITQGDGTSTSITVYATDTMGELRQKLNDAIANGLGQKNFTSGEGVNNFVSYVEQGSEQNSGLETVAGTFIIRSLIAGDAGKLTLSGDEDLINAFSLNVVQEARENSFVANVYDAHTLESIATDVKVSGNRLIGVVHPNVDVEFDSTAGLEAKWDPDTRNFVLTKTPDLYETVLHMVDNSTIFQVGANEGEDLAIDIGDMSAASLGVNRVVVTSREVAGRSIGILDTAINRVSAQRAKLGAYQNSLEYTVTNLTTTTTNLTAAESRIRDADMAKEMMELVKLQILNQSGTSMLAQANQLPQSVLSLLG